MAVALRDGNRRESGGGTVAAPGELNTGNPVIDAVDTSSVIMADMILATENDGCGE